MTLNGEYYIQNYNLSTNMDIVDYYIATTGLPDGTKITDTNGIEKETFGVDETFQVRLPKNSVETGDIKGRIRAGVTTESYALFYASSYDKDLQDYTITGDPLEITSSIAELNLKGNTGKIKIIKKDVDTDLPIEGVTFELCKTDGTVIGNATTDENGEASFSNLYQDDYILKEKATNDNYVLSELNFDVNVKYNKTTTKTITNEHKKGDLKIYKIDADNKKLVLGNVEFQLYSEELKKVIGTYYTDENGELKIEDLRIGNYKLIETKTNKWYNLAEDTELEIKWDEETTKNIENELKKGQIKVVKIDKDNNEVRLEGVEFEVLNENNELLEKITTDEKGEALTSRYPTRDFEKLKIRETKTLDTYVLSNEVKTIKLEANKITDVIIENEKIKGKVEITKVDAKDENKKLEGATFGLYDANNNLIEKLITDKDGKALSSFIPFGKYYLKELETGSVYYLLNKETFEFEIVKNGEVVSLTIDNEPTDVKVDVDKEGTVEIKPGEDVNYTFKNIANNSNVYLENFKWFDYIPTEYIRLEKMTTGTWNQDLIYSVYYKTNKSEDYLLFKDNLKTTENYNLDFTTIEFADDEYIIETCFDFGKVETGFRESISPTMNCKSFDTLEDNDTFTNHTKTVGIYFGVTAEANSKWTTVTHIPQEPKEKLPKTGR